MKWLRMGAQRNGVIADILVELSVVQLLSIMAQFVAFDWLRLTISIISFILLIEFAIILRKEAYGSD